jgi:hypothetical protein
MNDYQLLGALIRKQSNALRNLTKFLETIHERLNDNEMDFLEKNLGETVNCLEKISELWISSRRERQH